jgi:hypothetical protein
MITTKSKLKQIIKEELAIAEYQTDRQYGQSYTSVNLRDPYAVDGELDMDAVWSNVFISLQIIEDLPLKDMPKKATYAAQLLRETLDEMHGGSPPVEEPSL